MAVGPQVKQRQKVTATGATRPRSQCSHSLHTEIPSEQQALSELQAGWGRPSSTIEKAKPTAAIPTGKGYAEHRRRRRSTSWEEKTAPRDRMAFLGGGRFAATVRQSSLCQHRALSQGRTERATCPFHGCHHEQQPQQSVCVGCVAAAAECSFYKSRAFPRIRTLPNV